MYHLFKNFRIIKSFKRKNFRIQMRKNLCRLKTFAKQKVSHTKKTFARESDKGRTPMPAAKKVDPLPLGGETDKNFRFELLPLPKGFKKCDNQPSVWLLPRKKRATTRSALFLGRWYCYHSPHQPESLLRITPKHSYYSIFLAI